MQWFKHFCWLIGIFFVAVLTLDKSEANLFWYLIKIHITYKGKVTKVRNPGFGVWLKVAVVTAFGFLIITSAIFVVFFFISKLLNFVL